MAHPIPLIRAAVVMPFLRWMQDNGRPAERPLQAVGLGFVSPQDKEMPIPLFSVFALFRLMAALEGPDIAARVITPHCLTDFGNLGQVVLGSHSPRDALNRAIAILPRYSSYEQLSLWPMPGGQSLRAGWSMALDEETMHLTQQFTAAIIWRMCAATGLPNATPRGLRIRPHPNAGLDHLRPWFGPSLAIAHGAPLEIDLDDALLDAPLRFGPMAASPDLPDDWGVLKGDGSLAYSARLALTGVPLHEVTINWLAAATGTSARSVQRALTAEGSHFRQLVDAARRDRAIGILTQETGQLGGVAAQLGYAGQSSLSRAVRRWTGASPKAARQAATSRSDRAAE